MLNSLRELPESVKKRKMKTIVIAGAAEEELAHVVEPLTQSGAAGFILIADKNRLTRFFEKRAGTPGNVEIIDIIDEQRAAQTAAQMVRNRTADIMMKGLMQTSVFMKAVLDKEKGFNSGKLISQISVVDKPYADGLQFITDCALAIKPTLAEKIRIIENAAETAAILGIDKPKVAVLAAVEVINPDMPETMDAAILSKMAERGQIKNAVVDGPFALDNAVSPAAAEHKGIKGEVAGRADILLVPDLLAGNTLHKSITFYARQTIASIIAGTDFPVVMTSRTDTGKNKIASVLLACCLCERRT